MMVKKKENIMVQSKHEKSFYKVDVIYVVDFVVNLALIVAILVYYKNLYSKIAIETFIERIFFSGSGILFISCVMSIFTAIIEFIYGVLRLRGRAPYETGNLRNFAMMWILLKGMILLVGVVAVLAGINLWTFLAL